MQRKSQVPRALALIGGLALFSVMIVLQAQQPVAPPSGVAPGRGAAAGRGGGGRPGRFKVYSPEAVNRGLQAYNTTCGYCHGERGKGGKAGPDLIASVVTLHDEDGVQLASHVRAPDHAKLVKIDASDGQNRRDHSDGHHGDHQCSGH